MPKMELKYKNGFFYVTTTMLKSKQKYLVYNKTNSFVHSLSPFLLNPCATNTQNKIAKIFWE